MPSLLFEGQSNITFMLGSKLFAISDINFIVLISFWIPSSSFSLFLSYTNWLFTSVTPGLITAGISVMSSNSGYNERERETILKGGIQTCVNLKNKEKTGVRPFYRPYKYNRCERNVANRIK